MKIRVHTLMVAILLLLNTTFALSQDSIWQNTNQLARSSDQAGLSTYFDANDQALRSKLRLAPNEVRGISDVIELPMPDGSLERFTIVESSSMEDGLAAQFPEIKSYKVYGIDDPVASGRVDISPKGFRGMLMTSKGRVFIDPVNYASNTRSYASSFRLADSNQSGEGFQCGVESLPENGKMLEANFSPADTANRISGSLITYRLAVSATSEYVAAVGGTLITAMAEINTAINRVNQIYERDLGVRFNLVTNNNLIIEVPPAEFNFSNNDGPALFDQNQTKIDATIGSANYDVGHIFSTGGGGVASPQACVDSGKAFGVTGLPNPTGDAFYIDFVAHEIAHQFGGNHTWSASTDGCNTSQFSAATAFEPGSGTTILSYAGICGAEDIASNSDATFHAGSIAEINTYIASVSSCGTTFAVTPANSDPTSVATVDDQVIPANTPFLLFGTAVDVGDEASLTYSWDQMNAATVRTNSGNLGTDLINNPLFRSYIPQPTATRYFPALRSQLNGDTTKAETLPTTSRTLNFRFTVRDGKSGQGTSDVAVTVAPSAAFAITTITPPSITTTSGATVNWDIASTTNPTINCTNVDINLLSFSDDGTTYAINELVSGTFNDGSETVTIPGSSPKARFVVQCSGRIFYAISGTDLTITGGDPLPTTGNTVDISTAENYLTIGLSSTPNAAAGTPTQAAAAGGGGGGGSTSVTLLTFLLGLLMRGCWLRGRQIEVVNP